MSKLSELQMTISRELMGLKDASGELSLSALRWVLICKGFSHLLGFLHHFVLAKVATSSIRVSLVLGQEIVLALKYFT